MNNKLGQNEKDFREQIKNLPRIKKLYGNKRKTAVGIVMTYIGYNTLKEELLRDAIYRVQSNYSRIGRKATDERFIDRLDSIYEDPVKESSYSSNEAEYGKIWTPEKGVQDNVVDKILKLYDVGLIQRLHTKNKDGAIDAAFIHGLEHKKISGEKDQTDFVKSSSIREMEDIFNQTTKLALKQRNQLLWKQ